MTCNNSKMALDCPLETKPQYILNRKMFNRANKRTRAKFKKISIMPVTSILEVQAVHYLVRIRSGDYIGQIQ